MTKIVKMLPVFSLVLGFSSQASADVDWSLMVKFSDGAIAKGTFITNDAGNELESWKVHVRKGLEAHDFVSKSEDGNSDSKSDDFGLLTTIPNPSWPRGAVESLEFGDFDAGYAIFYLGDLPTGDPITIIGALDCGKDCGVFQMGSIIDPPLPLDPVPEPISIILLGSGAVFFSLAMRRRWKKHDA